MATEKREAYSGKWLAREIWALFKGGGWKLFPLWILVGFGLSSVVQQLVLFSLPFFDELFDRLSFRLGGAHATLLASLGSFVLMMAAMALSGLATVRFAILQTRAGAHPLFPEVLKAARSMPFLALANSVFVLGLFAPVLVPMTFAILVGGVLKGAFFYVLLSLSFLLLLPMHIWAMRLTFAPYFMTMEGLSWPAAIKRSLNFPRPLKSALNQLMFAVVPALALSMTVISRIMDKLLARPLEVPDIFFPSVFLMAGFFAIFGLGFGVLMREATRLTRDEADLPT